MFSFELYSNQWINYQNHCGLIQQLAGSSRLIIAVLAGAHHSKENQSSPVQSQYDETCYLVSGVLTLNSKDVECAVSFGSKALWIKTCCGLREQRWHPTFSQSCVNGSSGPVVDIVQWFKQTDPFFLYHHRKANIHLMAERLTNKAHKRHSSDKEDIINVCIPRTSPLREVAAARAWRISP